MNMKTVIWACAAGAALAAGAARYEATWESLDARPVPQWWQDAKLGIFIHWGAYAVPAYAPTAGKIVYDCYSEWYAGRVQRGNANFTNHNQQVYGGQPYGNLAGQFRARFFDAGKWAETFRKAGAKYAVLTSKHHDGYALWPSPESPYFNAVALGPGRDLLREFSDAMARAGLHHGFYYSLLEYSNPLYPFAQNYGLKAKKSPLDGKGWSRAVNLPQMKELVEEYGAEIVWADGEWDMSDDDLLSKEFIAWLYNDSPVKDTAVVNDRWGNDTRGKHGGHYCTEYGYLNGDFVPDEILHPFEENRGIGNSFGYNRFERAGDYLTHEALVRLFARVVGGGGNLLLDVGPDADGLIPPIMEERLLQLGAWIDAHKEAIYGTRRGPVQVKDKVTSTKKGGDVWVFALDPELTELKFELNGKAYSLPLPPASTEPVRVVHVPAN